MIVNSGAFKTELDNFFKKAEKARNRVYQEAIKEVIRRASRTQPSVTETGGTFEIGKVPVLTRELLQSLTIWVNGNIKGTGPESIARSMVGVRAEDKVEFGFTAGHAAKMEYGDGKIEGRLFVTSAVQDWDIILAEKAARYGN